MTDTAYEIPTLRPGQTAISEVTFTPEEGSTVELANVTVRLIQPAGTTPITGADDDGVLDLTADRADDGDGAFSVRWIVADDAPEGAYYFRWESEEPSAVISLESGRTRFNVLRSIFPNP